MLLSVALVGNASAAQAGGMSQIGNYGGGHRAPAMNLKPGCRQPSIGGYPGGFRSQINNNINVYKPTTINNNINVYKPVNIDKNINVTQNIDASKNISVYKPITITNNIDNSKNIAITKSIDNSKYIDASKNININKNITINNGGGSDAAAIAIAAASASANASASVNFYGGASSASSANFAGAFTGGSGYAPEAPSQFQGGDIGNISVDITPAAPQCTFQDATVVKAIHAVCVSADHHEFPASHMVADTWINNGYEGEIARCIPGSHLKVTVGKVMQSNEGMAVGYSSGQILECALHEAVRHYKDGALKCAVAVPVPDCTERTNLRLYGTGDMFFSYRTKVCLETHEEYSAVASTVEDRR